MTSLKKRLLLSLSAAALAVPMAAGGVQAIEVVVLDQVNDSAQSSELSFENLRGEHLVATAAAIGNSAAFNVEGASDAAGLVLDQSNVGGEYAVGGAGTQLAGIELLDVALSAGTSDGLALTAAAIGNTLSGNGAGTIADLDLEQLNIEGEGPGFDGQAARIVVAGGVVGGLESTLSAAAIGNSASLAADAIGTGDALDVADQANWGNQLALIAIDETAVRPTGSAHSFDATAAALGNSLTLDAGTGALFLDSALQANIGDPTFVPDADGLLGLGQHAHVRLHGINEGAPPATPVGVDVSSFETFDSTLVAAAIGNSASLSAGGGILLDTIFQQTHALQEADIGLDDVHGLGEPTATAVAIGNSLSITAGGDLAFTKTEGGIFQVDTRSPTAVIDIQNADIDADLVLTTAAIGNSLSITTEGGFDLGDENAVFQGTYDGQYAHAMVDAVGGLEGLSGTVVAIGNSASITSEGDFSFGTQGGVAQLNEASQTTGLDLTELNGGGDVALTVASIGNSLSIDAGGEVSGVGAILHENSDPQGAELDLDGMGDFASLDATVVAIGNSLSLSAGSFGGTGALSIAQSSLAPQLVSVELADAGLGALSATTAAIGNSASVTIR